MLCGPHGHGAHPARRRNTAPRWKRCLRTAATPKSPSGSRALCSPAWFPPDHRGAGRVRPLLHRQKAGHRFAGDPHRPDHGRARPRTPSARTALWMRPTRRPTSRCRSSRWTSAPPPPSTWWTRTRVFRGGVICPGLSTGLRALGERCAQLPQVHLASRKAPSAPTPRSCMLSGSVLGTAVLLDGIAQRIEEELGRPATLGRHRRAWQNTSRPCAATRSPMTRSCCSRVWPLLYQMNAPQHHAGGGKKRNQNFHRARRPHPQRRDRREEEAKAG